MALVDGPRTAGPWRPRSELDTAAMQLAAVDRFHTARTSAELAGHAAVCSRELRLDAARRLDVIHRQHDAIIETTRRQLAATGAPPPPRTGRRVGLAHRNDWFADRIEQALAGTPLDVVARMSNGADAVGFAVAEQPDLLLVEDQLPMLGGEDLVTAVRRYCPGTLIVVQTGHGDRIPALLDAGATSVFTRAVPPAEIALALRELVSA